MGLINGMAMEMSQTLLLSCISRTSFSLCGDLEVLQDSASALKVPGGGAVWWAEKIKGNVSVLITVCWCGSGWRGVGFALVW